jgi:hypothetical protein
VEGIMVGHSREDPPRGPEVAPIRLARIVEIGFGHAAKIVREHALALFQKQQRTGRA